MRKPPGALSELVLALLEQHGPQTSRELTQRCGKSQGHIDEVLRALRHRGAAHIFGHRLGAGTNQARVYAAGAGTDAHFCGKQPARQAPTPVERVIEERHGTHMVAAIRRAMDSDQPRRIYVGGRLIYSRETGIVEAAA